MKKIIVTVKTEDLKDKLFLPIAKPYKNPAISKDFDFRYLLNSPKHSYNLTLYNDTETDRIFSFNRVSSSKVLWIAGDYKLGVWDEDTPDMS